MLLWMMGAACIIAILAVAVAVFLEENAISDAYRNLEETEKDIQRSKEVNK